MHIGEECRSVPVELPWETSLAWRLAPSFNHLASVSRCVRVTSDVPHLRLDSTTEQLQVRLESQAGAGCGFDRFQMDRGGQKCPLNRCFTALFKHSRCAASHKTLRRLWITIQSVHFWLMFAASSNPGWTSSGTEEFHEHVINQVLQIIWSASLSCSYFDSLVHVNFESELEKLYLSNSDC